MEEYYEFKVVRSAFDGSFDSSPASTASLVIDASETTLSEVIAEFERFLRMAGFSLKGKLEVVEE